MSVLDPIGRSLAEAWWMLFATFWALVLGFVLSGAVQAFAPRAALRRSLGDHRLRSVANAAGFGAISSSCSYAASALAKSLFAGGADFTTAMVFMFASTNLVIELAAVLWLLLGWQFALAELVGGVIMIGLLAVALPRAIPTAWLDQARRGLDGAGRHQSPDGTASSRSWHGARSRAGWSEAAGFTISDLVMLRRELLSGFVVAGFAAEAVPAWFWRSLFLTGHGFGSAVENALLGPFLAIISFACSIGNVPIAAALWQGGISFGGVVAFVFADLIALPLLAIYCKYYGLRVTARLLAVFWAVMAIAGITTEYLFRGIGLVPPSRAMMIATMRVGANSATVLDLLALGMLAVIYALHRSRGSQPGHADHASDRVCHAA